LFTHCGNRLALALSSAALAALCVTQRIPMADALVYRAEGAAVANGTDLYGFTVIEWQLPATYPPFAAILGTRPGAS
jgi:alpha-1,2-mannosyltransferase